MKLEREFLGTKIFSGLEVHELVCDLASLILEFVHSNHGVSASCLQDLDSWLIETEKDDLGISGSIRTFFKSSEVVKETIRNSKLVQYFPSEVSGPITLHDIVRLRTVMSSVGYTISRPHQDIALWKHDPHAINVWLPFVDVDQHLSPIKVYDDVDNIFEHFTNEHGQQEISSERLSGLGNSIVTMKVGEVLTFSPTQIHHSTENFTNRIRWSTDFRLKGKNV